jgi:hypothetical protein
MANEVRNRHSRGTRSFTFAFNSGDSVGQLSLPKRFAASTLEIFRSEYIPRRRCSPRGRP